PATPAGMACGPTWRSGDTNELLYVRAGVGRQIITAATATTVNSDIPTENFIFDSFLGFDNRCCLVTRIDSSVRIKSLEVKVNCDGGGYRADARESNQNCWQKTPDHVGSPSQTTADHDRLPNAS